MDVIYTLSDPRDNQVRYVGKTDNPERRLVMHLRDKDICHRTNWLRELTTNGLEPILTIIETVEEGQSWEEREIYWISYYRSIGCKLTNGTDGGDQGPDCTGKNLIKSEQGRKNIIAALVKRNKSPEMREVSRRNGQSGKGRKRPIEAIEQQRQKMIGRKIHTDEFKQALAESNKTREYDAEKMRKNARKLWDDPVKGAEMRARLAERNQSEEFKQVLAERMETRTFAPEVMSRNSRKLWDDPIKGPEARARLIERNKNRKRKNSTE
jgi:hypothetical protein